MPGIIGSVRNDGKAASLSLALATLRHTPDTHCEEKVVTPDISLGLTSPQPKSTWRFNPDRQTGVMFTGTILSEAPYPHVVDSRELLDLYDSSGFKQWASFEGSFVIVLVDLRSRKIYLYNDRLGSLPLVYAKTANAFCFAPEAKAIFAMDSKLRPKLSSEGLIAFLTAGYPLGDRTIFEDTTYLEPASILSVDLNDLSVQSERYWNLVYEQMPSMNRKQAASELHEAVVDSCKLLLTDNPSSVDLLLSGGLDSRGILGALLQLDRAPQRALTWGLQDDIERSDANIAKRLAHSLSIPFHFYPYDTGTFVQNAPHWAYISELMNDNFGWYAEAPCVFQDFYGNHSDFGMIGDEIWGWQNYASNLEAAVEYVLPSDILPPLRESLRPGRVNDVTSRYQHQINRSLQRCNNSDMNDVKDYLYLNIRVARFIFSVGYYKEIAMELRRPFLTRRTIEVVRHMPAHLRLDKNAYIAMLKRYMPEVMVQPSASVSSVPDWCHAIRFEQSLRTYLSGLLDFDRVQATPLGELLDRNKFENLRDRYFAASLDPVSRRFSKFKETLTSLRRAVESRSPQIGLVVSKLRRLAGREMRQRSTYRFLRRVALCTLLQENLHLFNRTGKPQRKEQSEIVCR